MGLAGGAQIVARLIESLSGRLEPGHQELLTVFCGMLMNYSCGNGKDLLPRQDLLTSVLLFESPRGLTRVQADSASLSWTHLSLLTVPPDCPT